MSDDVGMTTADLLAALKRAAQELIESLMADAKGDVKAYAQLLAQEFGRYLDRARKGDGVAAENLRDLRAQVRLLAVKREIVAQRDILDAVQRAIEIVASYGLKVLIAAAV